MLWASRQLPTPSAVNPLYVGRGPGLGAGGGTGVGGGGGVGGDGGGGKGEGDTLVMDTGMSSWTTVMGCIS